MAEQVETSLDPDRFDIVAAFPQTGDRRPVGADGGHFPAGIAHAVDQRQQEMLQREVDSAELADLHVHCSRQA